MGHKTGSKKSREHGKCENETGTRENRMPAMCNFLTDSLTFYDDFMEMYDFSQWLKDNQAGLSDLDE